MAVWAPVREPEFMAIRWPGGTVMVRQELVTPEF
jgi:hypothetical protein